MPTPPVSTPWVPMYPITPAAPAGASLTYKGDWVAGSYVDGDVVVRNGVAFMCLGGPTTDTPDVVPWGSGSGIPPVTDGKWMKGVGGAMVWSDVVSTRVVDASAANIDLPAPVGVEDTIFLNPAGGSIRSISTVGVANGTRVTIWNWIGTPTTLKLNLAGGGGKLWMKKQLDEVLNTYDAITFVWDSTMNLWVEVSRSLRLTPADITPAAELYSGSNATATSPQNQDCVYTPAGITITPGTWRVDAWANMASTVNLDYKCLAIWNETDVAPVGHSMGPGGVEPTLGASSIFCTTTCVVTVTANKILRPLGLRNGGSGISMGAPTIVISQAIGHVCGIRAFQVAR